MISPKALVLFDRLVVSVGIVFVSDEVGMTEVAVGPTSPRAPP